MGDLNRACEAAWEAAALNEGNAQSMWRIGVLAAMRVMADDLRDVLHDDVRSSLRVLMALDVIDRYVGGDM